MTPYKNLKDLKSFKLIKFIKRFQQKWNEQTRKYERFEDVRGLAGFSPRYLFELEVNGEKCLLHFSQSQLAEVLVNCFNGDNARPIGETFSVKSNGKEGKDVRWFFNRVVQTQPTKTQEIPVSQENVAEEYQDIQF